MLPDAAIVTAALEVPRTKKALTEISAFTGRSARRYMSDWLAAVGRARAARQPTPPAQHPG